MPPFDHAGATPPVTGASSGPGAEFARQVVLILAGAAASSLTPPAPSTTPRRPEEATSHADPSLDRLEAPPPHDGPVTVMASRPELARRRDVPPFLAAALRIRRRMLGSPGALRVSLIARPARHTFWTLSAWQDQASLSAAVGRQPHRQIMRRFRPRIAASSFVTWTVPATALPVGWDEALRRLDNPGTVRRHGQSGRTATADGTPASGKDRP
jgi:hypothetical protein